MAIPRINITYMYVRSLTRLKALACGSCAAPLVTDCCPSGAL